MLKASIFREYDIRGVAATDLLDDDLETLGRAIATYLIRHSGRTVVLGRDTRASSTRLHKHILKGLLAGGAHVLDIAVVPSPVLSFATIHFKADGSVMITGGHAAPEINGCKIVSGTDTLFGDALRDILKLTQASDYETGGGDLKEVDALTPYLEELGSQFHFKNKIKIAVDSLGGAAGPVVHRLAKKLQLDLRELNADPAKNGPATFDSYDLKDLRHAVKKHGLDLGVALDGDGDRFAVLDENGRVVDSDMLMLIFGREILSRKPGATIVGEVKCSQVMYDKLKEWGGNPIMHRIGHPFIRNKMKQEHAELAGETSGHLFFADMYFGYDDGIYATCRLIDILSVSGKSLSAQLDGLPKRVSAPEERIPCADDIKFKVVARACELIAKKRPVIAIDGVRVPFENGWALLRASNTEPALTLTVEATNKDFLQQYKAELDQALSQARKEIA